MRQEIFGVDDFFRVARHKEEFRIGAKRRSSLSQLQAIHMRHHDIAQHQVDLARLSLTDFNGFRTVLCRQYFIAASLKR
jgi:hypothetical protein